MSETSDYAASQFLTLFSLTPQQARAAALRGQNLIVTAGAGSGKTRTLVARYTSLLAEGHTPSQIAAITFTEKAAREMRNRVRQELSRLAREEAEGPGPFPVDWGGLEAQMDAARIGTIHSLCAEILRAHPAESGLDPEFEVLDENTAALLRAQTVQDCLAWAMEQRELRPLFAAFETGSLEKLLAFGLQRRLDLAGWLLVVRAEDAGQAASPLAPVIQWALELVAQAALTGPIQELRSLQSSGRLPQDGGDTLAARVADLLTAWDAALQALENGQVASALGTLKSLFGGPLKGSAGKTSSASRAAVEAFKGCLKPQLDWVPPSPDPQAETAFESALARLTVLFTHLLDDYQRRLDELTACDFDALEGEALRLLDQPAVRRHWQAALRHLLVDEFQDTNPRQRAIIERLVGDAPGRLFVVGDDRQSIYRFRGADVTVFRALEGSLRSRGGQSLTVDETFRAHPALLDLTGCLLEPAMRPPSGAGGDDAPPAYWVPYRPLTPARQSARECYQLPYIEFVVGMPAPGESTTRPHLSGAAAGREAAATALAARLLELKQSGELPAWEDAGLLFRASTGFPPYEDALSAAGIPYVTVAGSGFYDRPEVRDALNILRALADPWDDLALAGLLRSPAFGVSDAGLYLLRWGPPASENSPAGDGGNASPVASKAIPLRLALEQELSHLDPLDRECAGRALDFLNQFTGQVGRQPVAALLKHVLDAVDYHALLAAGPQGSGAWLRMGRNLDQLLADAHASRLVQVRAFLEYIQTLREVGARQGEAPAALHGAVQLMTIHKAKGLEFDLVVIANAARQMRPRPEPAYLLPGGSLAACPDRPESEPLLYRFARDRDARESAAEEVRLLYVAATRAREKLIVSAHLGQQGRPAGWLKELVDAGDLQGALQEAVSAPGERRQAQLPGLQGASGCVAVQVRLGATPLTRPEQPSAGSELLPGAHPLSDGHLLSDADLLSDYHLLSDADLLSDRHLPPGDPIYPSPGGFLPPEPEPAGEPHEAGARRRPWRATSSGEAPPEVTGRLVHQALQRWLFPPQPELEPLLRAAALNEGLVDPEQRLQAIDAARVLLARLRQHPLWAEIDASPLRRHEIPYALPVRGDPQEGAIDLLYAAPGGWRVVDFKTEPLPDAASLEAAVEAARPRLKQSIRAIRELLGAGPQASVCFLDFNGEVDVRNI